MTKANSIKHVKRANTIRLLRKIHGWLGLWGALLGLLFGVSGFLLNHRSIMKIPAAKMEESEIQLAVPAQTPKNNKEFTRFIQETLKINQDPVKPKGPKGGGKPEHDARFMDKDVKQPQTFKVSFQLPQAHIEAEYIAGNQYALVKREDANIWGFITRMHKGVGANAFWVLLADTIGGAMMVLSITGVLLWTKMRGSRIAMVSLIGGSTILTIWATALMM